MNIPALYKTFLSCSGVTTDTRKITPNSMFFALKGDNFNGNNFAKEALNKGAKFAVVDDCQDPKNEFIIVVDNVLSTLQKLANYHRQQLKIPIIALTGSNGKTTTKELINAVLSKQFNTSATKGNLNNHIGVPLTLLSMTKTTNIGIVEMGANHPQEIAFLCEIAQPDFGLITNFGKAHLEGFGSIEGVIKAKSELYDYLRKAHKTIFANADDPRQLEQIDGYKSTILFGETQQEVSIKFLEAQPYVTVAYKDLTIESHLTGAYNFGNICYAMCIGAYFKIAPDTIKAAIEGYIPSNNRSQVFKKGSNEIILDAYNANPTSMKAALDNFKQYKHPNKLLILGDMLELGTSTDKEHQYIVDAISNTNYQNIFLVGAYFNKTTTNATTIKKFKSFTDLSTFLAAHKIENSAVLIKGSRGMALERTLDYI